MKRMDGIVPQLFKAKSSSDQTLPIGEKSSIFSQTLFRDPSNFPPDAVPR